MKKKALTIRMQLLIGFVLVLAFVASLGLVSFVQTRQLYEREKTLYEHPLQVKEATDSITSDILASRVAIRDFVIFGDEVTRESAMNALALSISDIEDQFDIIYALYLGPINDIDQAYQTFTKWKVATENRIAAAQDGNIARVIESLGDQGDVGTLRIQLTANIKTIDDFASNKAIELNTGFVNYYHSLVTSSTILLASILILSMLIVLYIFESIRNPLNELNQQIANFHEGKLSARSRYLKNNEFGALSTSFNAMADAIELNLALKAKAASISDAMQRYEDQNAFFRNMLVELAKELNANTAAVYLLNNQKQTYDCFDSIGLSQQARQSFDARTLEGEFGMVLATQKTQYICRLQEDSQFPVSSGDLGPREIITIPIISGNEIIAIISLTSMNQFFEHANRLIDNIVDTISARIEGVLAFRTIKDMLVRMERQNLELDSQKNELSTQADELMQQNAALDMQSSQLAEASKLKTTFLSNMSHELRTPLNSIIALSGVLTRRLSNQIPEEELSYLEIVERNGKTLLSLINDILDISRIEAGREEVEITSFGLNGLVNELIQMLNPLATQKGILLNWNAPQQDIMFSSDERKCRHILQNIISNAVKFTESGVVTIEAEAQGGFVAVSVTDTGIGISKENLEGIFNEFQQADGSTSRKYGGSGLGLAIAKKYAELLGGTIQVSSAIGAGSTFVVSLPISYQSAFSPEQRPSISAASISELQKKQKLSTTQPPIIGKTILIIEDSEPAVLQIRDIIERSGQKILVARSAREAYRIVETQIPDAIILDLMMPEIDGFETLNELRATAKTANVPVLILTAKHITREDMGRLNRNHVSQIVQKGGINAEEFLTAVMGLFEHENQPSNNPPTVNLQKQDPPEQNEPKRSDGKPRILVVEDNEDNRTTVRALLSDDFEVIEAENGERGIELAKTRMPDLVLMDIALPGISGIEAFHSIRNAATTRRIPIIALTASAMIQERSIILAHGFDAFVAKPIHLEELLKAIGVVLYGR